MFLTFVLYFFLCFTRAASILSTLSSCSFLTKSLLTFNLTISFCIVYIRSLTFLEALNFFNNSFLIYKESFFIFGDSFPVGVVYTLRIYWSVRLNPSLIEFHLMRIIWSCRALSNFSYPISFWIDFILVISSYIVEKSKRVSYYFIFRTFSNFTSK